MDKQTFIVDADSHGERLDSFLAEECSELTRSHIKKLIDIGLVKINEKTLQKSGVNLKNGDIVTLEDMEAQPLSLEPCDTPIDIVYEDDYLAVVNKAQGMVVHPATGSPNGTLVNCLLYSLNSLSSINGVIRPGIVHRLDKDTSGLLVIAKTDFAHISLQKQIAEKSADRRYIALVDGDVKSYNGVIVANIDRSHKDRKLMAITREGGRYAETHYKVIERFGRYTLMEFQLKTGRTHQIRVHSKYIGHAIVGDSAYGGSVKLYNAGQLLHAYKLEFTHPLSNERLVFEADLPPHFQKVLELLRRN